MGLGKRLTSAKQNPGMASIGVPNQARSVWGSVGQTIAPPSGSTAKLVSDLLTPHPKALTKASFWVQIR